MTLILSLVVYIPSEQNSSTLNEREIYIMKSSGICTNNENNRFEVEWTIENT
ncbi:hypothetical protein VPH5P1C_0106 [Vibrio phage 5P1c]